MKERLHAFGADTATSHRRPGSQESKVIVTRKGRDAPTARARTREATQAAFLAHDHSVREKRDRDCEYQLLDALEFSKRHSSLAHGGVLEFLDLSR